MHERQSTMQSTMSGSAGMDYETENLKADERQLTGSPVDAPRTGDGILRTKNLPTKGFVPRADPGVKVSNRSGCHPSRKEPALR